MKNRMYRVKVNTFQYGNEDLKMEEKKYNKGDIIELPEEIGSTKESLELVTKVVAVDGGDVPAIPEDIDLEAMNIKQLKALTLEKGIKVKGKKKAAYIEALK